jgi:hypothetical protein
MKMPTFSRGSPTIKGIKQIGTIRTYSDGSYSFGVAAEPTKIAIPTFTTFVGRYATPIPTRFVNQKEPTKAL